MVPGGTSEAFATQVVADFPSLDVLFNNAGSMTFEDLTGRRDLADAERIPGAGGGVTVNPLPPGEDWFGHPPLNRSPTHNVRGVARSTMSAPVIPASIRSSNRFSARSSIAAHFVTGSAA